MYSKIRQYAILIRYEHYIRYLLSMLDSSPVLYLESRKTYRSHFSCNLSELVK